MYPDDSLIPLSEVSQVIEGGRTKLETLIANQPELIQKGGAVRAMGGGERGIFAPDLQKLIDSGKVTLKQDAPDSTVILKFLVDHDLHRPRSAKKPVAVNAEAKSRT